MFRDRTRERLGNEAASRQSAHPLARSSCACVVTPLISFAVSWWPCISPSQDRIASHPHGPHPPEVDDACQAEQAPVPSGFPSQPQVGLDQRIAEPTRARARRWLAAIPSRPEKKQTRSRWRRAVVRRPVRVAEHRSEWCASALLPASSVHSRPAVG
jgi:hypothetical protein